MATFLKMWNPVPICFFFQKLMQNSWKIKLIIVQLSGILTFTMLCNYYLYLIPKHFHHPVWSSHSHFSSSPAQATTDLISVCMSLPLLDTSFKWNHTIHDLLLTILFSSFIHVVAGIHTLFHLWMGNFPLYEYTTFVYSSVHWRAFGLVSPFGSCEWCCYEYSCTSICVNICFQFFEGIELMNHMVILCLTYWRSLTCFPQWLRYLTSPPAISLFFLYPCQHLLLLPPLSFYHSHSCICEMLPHCGFNLHFSND